MKKTYYKLIVGFVGLIVLVPIVQYLHFGWTPYHSNRDESKNVKIITIMRGDSPHKISMKLVQSDLISSHQRFIQFGKWLRQWPKVKSGEYAIPAVVTPWEIFSIFRSGVVITHPVTVREGENIYEISQDLERQGLSQAEEFRKLCLEIQWIQQTSLIHYFHDDLPPSLEGYLFPDTYFLNRSMNDQEIILQMTRHFFDHWGAQEDSEASALHLTRHEVVTLASMIEKETGVPEERPVISSVFHNRLSIHMKLQSDPTTIYGMWSRFRGKIHKTDLLERNDYNTYVLPRLPIGPIGNPGVEAIQAALKPIPSQYFYFVSKNDGTHEFSETMENHLKAVKKYQLDPKARIGKSWRNRLPLLKQP